MDEFIIYKDQYFTVEHNTLTAVEGYLILSSNDCGYSNRPNLETLSRLGLILELATDCIGDIVNPERVYRLLFCEKNQTPHYHLFPRTQEIKSEYESLYGRHSEGFLSGPDLFAWVLAAKKGRLENISILVDKMRNLFEEKKHVYFK